MKPATKRWVVFVSLGMMAMMLAGCDGGGGAPVPPAAPTVTVSYGIKSVNLSWGAVQGVTHYRVFRDPDGVSGFSQIGGDQTSTVYSDTLSLHLTDWVNVRYKVAAYDAAGEINSTVVDDPDLLKAIGYFKASNGPVGFGNFQCQFGARVALSADGATMAVGAFTEDSDSTGVNGDQNGVQNQFDAGAVYVFTRTGATWSQQAYLKASNTDPADLFGWSLSLSADGNTLAVGAIGEDSAATGIGGSEGNDAAGDNSGAVYVFTRTGASWAQQAYIKASNTDPGDVFSSALALSADGDTLAVGSRREASSATGIGGSQADNSDQEAGAVYVFRRTSGIWSQETYVKSSRTDDSLFGHSVALSGDGNILAVSSSNNPIGAQANGAVSVFTRSGTVWTQQTRLLASNDAFNLVGLGRSDVLYYGFGSPLALSADGNTLAAGAYTERSAATGVNGDQADDMADNAGAVYVFMRAGATWSQQAYVKASNTDAGDLFGASVALSPSGDTLAVGAPSEGSSATGVNGDDADDANVSGTGAVYVFTRTGASWAQKAYVKPSNTHRIPNQNFNFGISVALSSGGDSLAVGALTEESAATGIGGDQTDVTGGSAGAVYLY